MMTRWRKPYATETDLVQTILDYLRRCRIVAWRQNSGGCGRLRWGTPGCGDITGILPGGRRLEIECKTDEGEQSGAQKAFQVLIEQHGGVYIVARRLEDIERIVRIWQHAADWPDRRDPGRETGGTD